MARPRKNRIGEYASALGDEIAIQLSKEIKKTLDENLKFYESEVAKLRAEIRALSRRLETVGQRSKPSRQRIGKWVPGGPGRPPKDAAQRIAAFESRSDTTKKKKPAKRAQKRKR